MCRFLLILSLFIEGAILLLESPDLPYPAEVRGVGFLLEAAALLMIPFGWRRNVRPEVLEFSQISSQEEVYLGRGGEWETREAEQLAVDPQLHPERNPLRLPVAFLDRHVLLLGTTGAGKTRMMELFIAHAILRGDAVVVLDPKGDERLLQIVREACRQAGRSDAFRFLSLPDPSRSAGYNPVGDFGDPREVADRIAALLPSRGEAQTFRSYAWEVIHVVTRGILAAGEDVTLERLRHYSAGALWELVAKVVGRLSGGALNGTDGRKAVRTYERWAAERKSAFHPDLAALVESAHRPPEHYQKMTAPLVPVLAKLAACPMLNREGVTWGEAAKGQVVYFELGSLLGAETASAVARMTLLDLQSFVGRRFASRGPRAPLSLFVDEAADVVTPEFLPLLSKGRGAGVRILLAAQTRSDFEVALGSRAAANQVMGNLNTVIQFRAENGRDAEVFSEMCGERLLPVRSEGERYEPGFFSSGSSATDDFRASFGWQRVWNRQPLVPTWALTGLPPYCYFARWGDHLVLGQAPLLEVESEVGAVLGPVGGGGDGARVAA